MSLVTTGDKIPLTVDNKKPGNCDGCGVCCFHMGFPAFNLPKAPMTDEEIEADASLRSMPTDPNKRAELLNGSPGEDNWLNLPQDLRQELEEFIRLYTPPSDGELDPPCFWLDIELRQCTHHEFRPRVCREFEIGSRACLDWRQFYLHRLN